MKITNRKSDKGFFPVLTNHIRQKDGKSKTVCVSSVLSYFGIAPGDYKYSQNDKARDSRTYLNILRRNGWKVGNRRRHFKNCKTVNQMVDSMEFFIDPINRKTPGTVVHYLVRVSGHIFVMDSMGRTCIDTAPTYGNGDRRKIWAVYSVTKK